MQKHSTPMKVWCIENHNPIAALELDELFSLTISHLERHPELGREGRVMEDGAWPADEHSITDNKKAPGWVPLIWWSWRDLNPRPQ